MGRSSGKTKRTASKAVSIQAKILSALLATLLVTVIVVVTLVYRNQRASLLEESNRGVSLTTNVLFIALKNLMLDGKAPLMVQTLAQLRELPDFRQIAVYRTTGELAFSDYATVEAVNRRQAASPFEHTERIVDDRSSAARQRDIESIAQVDRGHEKLSSVLRGADELDTYVPIPNLQECQKCHGSDHELRGVAHLRISLAPIHQQIDRDRTFLILFFAAVGAVLLGITFWQLRRLIIGPVLKIGRTVAEVGQGNFHSRVELERADELGTLAREINLMTKGLQERFELSKYVSRSTEQVVSGEVMVDGHGDQKTVTLLFSDIRGFTAYAESRPPKQVIEKLNRLLELQAETVDRWGGDIDKFVGDQLMALFDSPSAAVGCAWELMQAVERAAQGDEQGLRVGVGLNTGEVLAGHIGSAKRREYAVIGDTVNVAARLCAVAPPGTILLSSSTHDLVHDDVDGELLPDQKVKGRRGTLDVYALHAVSLAPPQPPDTPAGP